LLGSGRRCIKDGPDVPDSLAATTDEGSTIEEVLHSGQPALERSRRMKEGREAWLLGGLLFRLYGLIGRRSLRALIRNVVLRLEGGGHYSRTIRRILSSYHQIEVGMYTSGPCIWVDRLPPGTTIGRYCATFPTARAFGANHPTDRMSQHAFFYNPKLGYAVPEDDVPRTRLVIGNDVILYHNVTILPTVKRVGDGAVIAAGAVVTKDVPDFAIVAGNPAKVLKYRFPEEIQRRVRESKWWDKPIDELVEELGRFQRPL